MVSSTSMLGSYFNDTASGIEMPPYFTLGARSPAVGTASIDSSDQSVLTFDAVTGVAACRSGVNIVGVDQEVVRRDIGTIVYVTSHPTAPSGLQLRAKLALEQTMRMTTGVRPFYTSLRAGPPMIPPRLVAAGVRIVEDYRRIQLFANSIYTVPGMVFMADGRLNAQNYPGPAAVDRQARLLRARGVRYVGLAKDGLLVSAVTHIARAIRKKVGLRPFAFPIVEQDLRLAYRASGQSTASPKTIRHGSSSSALGGVGAVRFALSLAADNLLIVEMSLYDFDAFAGLVFTGERLEAYVCRCIGLSLTHGHGYPALYSWDLLPFVTESDWERHILPTLEELVFSAYTDTELGIYPRALADIHNHVKLRFDDPELETHRREIIVDLARMGIPIEKIPVMAAGSHKMDPDEFDALTP